MKIFFITLSSFLLFFSSYGQGDLQFNQVIIEMIRPSNSTSAFKPALSAFTVPSGKVWKIENATTRGIDATDSDGSLFPYNTGGFNVIYFREAGTQTLATLWRSGGELHPIWLPSGTYDLYGSGGSGDNSVILLNAIEFNIIP